MSRSVCLNSENTLRSLVALAAFIGNFFLLGAQSARASTSSFFGCESLFHFLNQPDLVKEMKDVDAIKSHQVRIFTHDDSGEWFVVLGERHNKDSKSIEVIDRLLKRFGFFAIEVPTDIEREEYFNREFNENVSAMDRIESFVDHDSIVFIDQKGFRHPFESFKEMLNIFFQFPFLGLGVLMNPKPHSLLDRILFYHRKIVTLRDEAMAENLQNLITKRDESSPMLVIVGVGHVRGLVRHFQKMGFREVKWQELEVR